MDLSDGKVRRRVNKALRERGVPAKACSRCRVVKVLSQFGTTASNADGHLSDCRGCRREIMESKRRSSAFKKRERARDTEYEASGRRPNVEARRSYMRDHYGPAYHRRKWAEDDAYRARRGASARQWRKENPERWRELKQRHEMQRRARKAAATIEPFTPADLRADWEEHDLWDCFFCGGPLTDMHVDHFYPLSPADEEAAPGPHAIFNLVPSCAECNLSKSNSDPWEFLRESLAERGVNLDAALAFFDVD